MKLEEIDEQLRSAAGLKWDAETQGAQTRADHYAEVIDALLDLRGEACAE